MRTRSVLRVVWKMDDPSSRLGDHGRYPLKNSANIMQFFSDDKYAQGASHAEYRIYWDANRDSMPSELIRLNGGMLADDFYANPDDAIHLHDARIMEYENNDAYVLIKLHGDHNGALRRITLRYADTSAFSGISNSLLANKPDCDLMCHELTRCSPGTYNHRMLFANSEIVSVNFVDVEIEVVDDA